jgi:molybdopterin-guanine dinucleotide biosynthesis protein A
MNAYVLVGGRSSRMGRPKSGLFWGAVAAAAGEVFDIVFAVQRNRGAAMPNVERRASARRLKTIFETDHPDEAPIFGVARALEHAASRGLPAGSRHSEVAPASSRPLRCVILAVDYPLLTPAFLRFLRERTAASSAPMVVPRWGGHDHVLCAGYAPALLPLLTARIAAGRYDLRSLAGEAAAEVIGEGEIRGRFGDGALTNVNTPAELERARRIG